jgi:yeast amino acid transporter
LSGHANVWPSFGTITGQLIVLLECTLVETGLADRKHGSSIRTHQKALDQHRMPRVRRHDLQNDDYPYRSHAQPFLAYAALAGCLFTLIVASGAALWEEFRLEAFLSSYLIVRSTSCLDAVAPDGQD